MAYIRKTLAEEKAERYGTLLEDMIKKAKEREQRELKAKMDSDTIKKAVEKAQAKENESIRNLGAVIASTKEKRGY